MSPQADPNLVNVDVGNARVKGAGRTHDRGPVGQELLRRSQWCGESCQDLVVVVPEGQGADEIGGSLLIT